MVRRRSSRFPLRGPRYRRVRRGGMANVSSRMSETSWWSSAGDSSVKSRLRSCSAADASWRRPCPSGRSSPSSPDLRPASANCLPDSRRPGSAADEPPGAGDSSALEPGDSDGTPGSWTPNGERPPKIAVKTRSKVGSWLGLDTIVARAQARNSASEEAFMTVRARASRSHRSGPTGSPAVCRATPNAAAVTPISGVTVPAGFGGSVNGGDHRSQPGLAHGLLVLGILQYRAQRLAGHRHGQVLLTEDADGEGPGDGLGDARWLGQVQGPEPLHRGRDLAGQPLCRKPAPGAG